MAHSEQQKATLELGKLLVKELGLDKGVDTLSRWMAHYLAEKITLSESLPKGAQRDDLEKECFALILDLWKNRWELRHDRQPLKNFRHLLEVLGKLDPRKSEPYYYHLSENQALEIKDDSFDPKELKNLFTMALQIDKVARIWIDVVLRQAAAKANNETIQQIVENAVQLTDNADSTIVQIVTSEEIDSGQPFDMESYSLQYRRKEIERRITELQKFEKVNDYLKKQYEKELNELKIPAKTSKKSKNIIFK